MKLNLKEMNTHELLVQADIFNKAHNEIDFQKIASELTQMKHSRFIDETENLKDRNFSIMILLKEDQFWDKNPDFQGCYEDTEEYLEIWHKFLNEDPGK